MILKLVLLLLLATPTISVKGNPRQGDPLFVMVRGAQPLTRGEIRFGNQGYELSPALDDGIMRTVVPVPVDLAPGRHRMLAKLSDGSTVERAVTIKKRDFGMQHITLSESTLASYDNPQNKADDQAILESLAPFHPERRWEGHFRAPISAGQSSPFGVRRLYNGWKRSYHKGLDLAGWEGQEIHAPADGVVLHVATGIVNGHTIVLGHGLGVGTVYLHCQDVAVQEGEEVHQGQVIGWVGGTGGFSPHLHYEVRVHGVPVEPHAMKHLPEGWR